MHQPLARGVMIDNKRYGQWLARFTTYRNVTRGTIELWMQQFSEADKDIAARLLDAVIFLDHQHMRTTLYSLFEDLTCWNRARANATGDGSCVQFYVNWAV